MSYCGEGCVRQSSLSGRPQQAFKRASAQHQIPRTNPTTTPFLLQDQQGGPHRSFFFFFFLSKPSYLVYLDSFPIRKRHKVYQLCTSSRAQQESFKCALVRKVDQKGQHEGPLISACADKILLSSGDACLLPDRRRRLTHAAVRHDYVCASDVYLSLQVFFFYTHSQILMSLLAWKASFELIVARDVGQRAFQCISLSPLNASCWFTRFIRAREVGTPGSRPRESKTPLSLSVSSSRGWFSSPVGPRPSREFTALVATSLSSVHLLKLFHCHTHVELCGFIYTMKQCCLCVSQNGFLAFLIICFISHAAGRDRGSGREASYPFSNPGIKEKGDWGHGGRVGQQEISSHAPQTAGRQGEPAQVWRSVDKINVRLKLFSLPVTLIHV